MTKYIYTCDKCGKESIQDRQRTPETWAYVNINVDGYNSSCDNTGRFHSRLELCPDCMAKLGIPPKETKLDKPQQVSTADRLYDIIADIAYENLPPYVQ